MADLLVVAGIGIPERAIEFRTSRSSGPGGQNVNKLDTRVELLFSPERTPGLSPERIALLRLRLRKRIDKSGKIRLVVQRHRSQWRNKDEALTLLGSLIENALRERLVRKATAPTRSSRRQRSDTKRRRGQTKRLRRPPGSPDED